MKLPFTFPVITLFCLLSKLLCAQEITDTITLKSPLPKFGLHLKYIDPHLQYNIDKSQFQQEQEKRMKEYIFQGKGWSQFKLEETLKPIPDGRKYQIYYSSNDALHYYSASDPIQFGFDYHLKPLLGWEKIDIYFFCNGILVYRYSADNPRLLSLPSRNFIWETGGGIEYEFSKNWFLFYEMSAVFRNQSFIGTHHQAGVRFRF
jgi:hypothetical protein